MAELPILLQTGMIGALLQGIHEGDTTIQTLARHGNCGIGTFDTVDGELIAFDGNFYRVDGGGVAALADPKLKTPFAMVTQFKEDLNFALSDLNSLEELACALNEHLDSKNYIYAIRIDGEFTNMKVRSLKPNPKPYKPLAEMLETIQFKFDLNETTGTIIATYFPQYMENINVPGFHLHFLDEAKKTGGHVFELKVKRATVKVCKIKNFAMHLPETEMFAKAAFKKDEAALHAVEKGE